MDYSALASEIANDPQSLGYLGKTDAEIADLLNLKQFDGDYNATFKTIMSDLGTEVCDRLINSMVAAGQSSPSVQRILNAVDNGVPVNMGDPVTHAMIDSFAANGALDLTTDDATALKGLSANMRSRADVLGFGIVKAYDVRRATA